MICVSRVVILTTTVMLVASFTSDICCEAAIATKSLATPIATSPSGELNVKNEYKQQNSSLKGSRQRLESDLPQFPATPMWRADIGLPFTIDTFGTPIFERSTNTLYVTGAMKVPSRQQAGESVEAFFFAVDAITGKEKWRAAIPKVRADFQNLQPPTVGKRYVYFVVSGAKYSMLYQVQKRTGWSMWSKVLQPGGACPTCVTAAVEKDGLLILGVGSSGCAYQPWQGTMWCASLAPGLFPISAAPVVVGSNVVFQTADFLFAVDSKTGAGQWEFRIPGIDHATSLSGLQAVSNRFVSVMNSVGNKFLVFILDGKTGHLFSATSWEGLAISTKLLVTPEFDIVVASNFEVVAIPANCSGNHSSSNHNHTNHNNCTTAPSWTYFYGSEQTYISALTVQTQDDYWREDASWIVITSCYHVYSGGDVRCQITFLDKYTGGRQGAVYLPRGVDAASGAVVSVDTSGPIFVATGSSVMQKAWLNAFMSPFLPPPSVPLSEKAKQGQATPDATHIVIRQYHGSYTCADESQASTEIRLPTGCVSLNTAVGSSASGVRYDSVNRVCDRNARTGKVTLRSQFFQGSSSCGNVPVLVDSQGVRSATGTAGEADSSCLFHAHGSSDVVSCPV